MTKKKYDRVYQFRITLRDIRPPIWRRIQVPETYSFWDLHVAIQDAMGWMDYHLHQFEVEAVIDTGATMIVLPQNIVDELGLKKIREAKVRYADNRTELKSIYGVITIDIKGRTGNFDVVAEAEGSLPLIGQVVLEILDLVVDPRTRTLIPNPISPEMPMVEILMAKLGSEKRPAVVRVKTMKRAEEILALCSEHGWQVIVGIEPDKPEDISDVKI